MDAASGRALARCASSLARGRRRRGVRYSGSCRPLPGAAQRAGARRRPDGNGDSDDTAPSRLTAPDSRAALLRRRLRKRLGRGIRTRIGTLLTLLALPSALLFLLLLARELLLALLEIVVRFLRHSATGLPVIRSCGGKLCDHGRGHMAIPPP